MLQIIHKTGRYDNCRFWLNNKYNEIFGLWKKDRNCYVQKFTGIKTSKTYVKNSISLENIDQQL